MQSLLAGVEKAHVETDPFPHVVVHGALDPRVADALLAELPPVELITDGAKIGSNEYHSYAAGKSLRNESLSRVWREFVDLHASPAFATQVFDLFSDHFPEQARARIGSRSAHDLGERGFGVRGFDEYERDRILLDAQVVLNTPVTDAPSSVKGPHIDRPRALYGATYYLRHDHDTSQGGALQLLRLRGSNLRRFDENFVDDDDVDVVKTIPYAHNVFVCWPNSIDALHLVSARSVTPSFRYYANLLAEFKTDWYDWTPYQRNPQATEAKKPRARLARRLLSRVGR